MKKTHLNNFLWIILLLHIPSQTLFSQEIPIEDLALFSRFQIGSGDGQLGSEPGIIGSGFADRPLLGSGAQDGFIIHDGLNRRIILFNDEFIQQRSIETSLDIYLTPVVADDGGTIILQSQSQGLYVFADFGYTDFPIYLFPEFRNYRSFAYYDDVLFVHDAELNLWSIPEPVMDQAENRAKLLNERQTTEYVNERWGSTGELQVDEEGRLFIDGQLVTRDYQQFWQYMEEVNGPVTLGGGIVNSGIPVKISYNTKPYFLGHDLNGNWYWNDSGGILVHSHDGSLINVFITELGTLSIRPAIDQLGNVYILELSPNQDQFNLYRIHNDWSPIDASLQSESGTSREVSQNPRATVINSRLRVRSAPSLEGEMLGMLEIGEEVRILEKSDQELNIGELTDFWYRIDNGNGLNGWAYGAFLNIKE
jgi:hypothetical protein